MVKEAVPQKRNYWSYVNVKTYDIEKISSYKLLLKFESEYER